MDRSAVASLRSPSSRAAANRAAVAPAPGGAVVGCRGIRAARRLGNRARGSHRADAGRPGWPRSRWPPIAIDVDSVARQIAAQDSAADAAALEALQGARPDTAEPIELPRMAAGRTTSMWRRRGTSTWRRTPPMSGSSTTSISSRGPAVSGWPSGSARLPKYETMIREAMQANNVPADMVYLALIESGYSNSAVSRARAAGMWQFMKGTGRMYGLQVNSYVDERRDPVKSTAAAARHLNDLQVRFGSIYLAAAAYNAGAGKVSRGLSRLPDDVAAEADTTDDANNDSEFFRLYDTKSIRRETKDYVPKLIAAALIAKEPAKYGFTPPPAVPAFSYDSIIVPGRPGSTSSRGFRAPASPKSAISTRSTSAW